MLERVAARDAWSASVLNIELIRFVCMLVRPGLGWAGLGWPGRSFMMVLLMPTVVATATSARVALLVACLHNMYMLVHRC